MFPRTRSAAARSFAIAVLATLLLLVSSPESRSQTDSTSGCSCVDPKTRVTLWGMKTDYTPGDGLWECVPCDSQPTPTPTASISGQITDEMGLPVDGVTITLTTSSAASTQESAARTATISAAPNAPAAIATAQTGLDGHFSFNNLSSGETYTVTPSSPDYDFSPSSHTFVNLPETATAEFTATKKLVKLVSIDERFAPSVERLDIKYSIDKSYTAVAAKLEIFKSGDATNPIYRDETIPKSGENVLYSQPAAEGQPTAQGWDGKINQGADAGKYAHPKDSPFTVRITIAKQADYSDAVKDEKTVKVEVESIALTPEGNFKVYKPDRAATEIDSPVEAVVKVKSKNGEGVATELPFTVEWSFRDPDDTASNDIIDGNGDKGDDNAPIANGGKRRKGTESPKVMWKTETGFKTKVAADGQTAKSEAQTSSTDKGKVKLTFSTSAIGGDNYILFARLKRDDKSVFAEQKSGKWSVWKRLEFANVFRMKDGVDVGTIMSARNIKGAFDGEGYTEYTRGQVQKLAGGDATSPEFVAPLINPIPLSDPKTGLPDPKTELPTPDELADYAGADATKKEAARQAITQKAQRWYRRSLNRSDLAHARYVNRIGAKAPAIIGARYGHPKLDGNPDTGKTDYYPNGIGIKVNNVADPVDPDGDWQAVQGLEIADIAFMYLNVISPQRRIVVGRHEAGHASDHEPFGLPTDPPENRDHATEDLMHPNSHQSKQPPDGVETFSPDSILRLRGWKR